MKMIIAVAAVAMLSSTMASAVEVKQRGAYMGGAIGTTSVDSDSLDQLESTPGVNFDDSDMGLQLWGGYKFFKWFAVEGRYAYLGEYTVSSVGLSAKLEAAAVTANAVFILPFGSSGWDIYGQVGSGVAEYEAKGSAANSSETELVGTAGVGVRWTPAPSATISFGYDVWSAEIDDGTGNDEDVNIGMARVGLQYNF